MVIEGLRQPREQKKSILKEQIGRFEYTERDRRQRTDVLKLKVEPIPLSKIQQTLQLTTDCYRERKRDRERKGSDLISSSKAAVAFNLTGSFLSNNDAAFFSTNRNVHTCHKSCTSTSMPSVNSIERRHKTTKRRSRSLQTTIGHTGYKEYICR